MGKPLEIDWTDILVDRGRDDVADVCFASPTLTARGKRKGDTPGLRRWQTRLGGLYRDSGAGERDRRALPQPLAGIHEDPKAADDAGDDARAAALKVYD